MFRLDGHSALITGGTQGVGASIAESLAAAGANVIVHGLEPSSLGDKTLHACRSHNVDAFPLYMDLSRDFEAMARELLERSLALFPNVDLLVNNAGTFRESDFLDVDFESFDRTMRLNLYSGFFLTQAFARHWVRNKVTGRVLFTGSINGILSEPGHVAYDASKGAVAAMVRSLCVSLAPCGIRVNSMAPGLVRTPLTDPVLSQDPAALEWMKLHTPCRQVPSSDVCGPAALFLLSDEAQHVHGQTLYVDGGMSAWQQPDLPETLRSKLSP